jgi:hypothetical protein
VAPLSQWCKTTSGILSNAIAGCLPDVKGKQQTRTFAKLERDLGKMPSGADGATLDTSAIVSVATSTEAHGLSKVAGMRELKELLRADVVAPVRNPEPYRRYGLSIPNGILLYGPPGCGKTYNSTALPDLDSLRIALQYLDRASKPFPSP